MKIKPTLLSILGATAFAFSPASAQSVATDPVGVVTIELAKGNNAVAIPFVTAPLFAGETTDISDVDGKTVFEFATPSFTSGEFGPRDDAPDYSAFYILVTSENSAGGLIFDVEANTESSVSVDGEFASSFGLSDTERVKIFEHYTVGKIFSNAEGMTAFVDSLKVFSDDGTSTTFLWDGTEFVDNSFQSVANFPIYPAQGFVFFGDGAVSLTVDGAVNVERVKIPVYSGSAVNFVGLLNPVGSFVQSGVATPVTLGSSGIGEGLEPFVGSVKFFSADGDLRSGPEQTFLWDGAVFRDGSFADASDVAISANSAFVISNSTAVYVDSPATISE